MKSSFCWREDALITNAARVWAASSKVFAIAKLTSNYNPSVVTFGKPQCLGHFIKEILICVPGNSSDTDSHLLCNPLKWFWDSSFFKEHTWSICHYKRKGFQPPQCVPGVIHRALLGNVVGLKMPVAQLTGEAAETSAALRAKLMHHNNWSHFSAPDNSSLPVLCCQEQRGLQCPWIQSTWDWRHSHGHWEAELPFTPRKEAIGLSALVYLFLMLIEYHLPCLRHTLMRAGGSRGKTWFF